MNLIQKGVGIFGQHWLALLAECDFVEVVALVDINEDALAVACDKYAFDPAICFATLDEAVQQTEADMLLCVTPPRFHRKHVVAGLQAGLHVLCEKPMAETLDDCVAMFEAARASGRQFAVAQNYRYRPATQTLSRLIAEGAIGEIGQVKLDFYKGWYFDESNFRRTMAHPLIVDMSIHHFDLLRFITALEPQTVRGESWNPHWSENSGDTSASLHFVLDNGARVVYSASWCAQGDFCDWNGNWLIEGEKGSLVYNKGVITLNHAAGEYIVDRPEVVVSEAMDLTEQAFLLSRFVDAAKSGQRPETDVADNLRSIAMVFAAVTAVATEKSTPILPSALAAKLQADG